MNQIRRTTDSRPNASENRDWPKLRDGSLVLVELEDAVPEQISITAVLPTRRQIPSRVRVFLDRLQSAGRADVALPA